MVKGSKSNVAGDLIFDMKAATETLGRTVVKRPLKKQNLCLDKGYDYPEIERESTKRRYVPHIRHRSVEKEL